MIFPQFLQTFLQPIWYSVPSRVVLISRLLIPLTATFVFPSVLVIAQTFTCVKHQRRSFSCHGNFEKYV